MQIKFQLNRPMPESPQLQEILDRHGLKPQPLFPVQNDRTRLLWTLSEVDPACVREIELCQDVREVVVDDGEHAPV